VRGEATGKGCYSLGNSDDVRSLAPLAGRGLG
jgi:hypothetical protein